MQWNTKEIGVSSFKFNLFQKGMFSCLLANLLFHVKNVAGMTGSDYSKQVTSIHATENIP